MLNLIISFDDPIERLLYGEPDPFLSLWECKHYDAGFPEHTHNDGDGNGDYGIGRPTRPIDLGEEPGTDFVDPSDYNPAPDSDAFNEWRQQQREAADALVQEYEAYADVWRDHREQYQDHPTALLKIDDCPECRRRSDAFQDAYREIVEEEPTADAEADLDRYESVLESPRGRNALLRTKRGLEAWIRYQGERRGLTERAIQAQIAGLRAGDEAARLQRPGGRNALAGGVTDGPEYLRGFGAVTDDPSTPVGGIDPVGRSDEVLGTAAGGLDARSAGVAGFGEARADAQEAWIRHQAQQQGLTAEQVEAQVEAWRSQRPDDTALDRPGPDGPEYLRGFGAVTDDPNAPVGRISPVGGSGEVVLGTDGVGLDIYTPAGPEGFDETGAAAAMFDARTDAELKIVGDAQAEGLSPEAINQKLDEYRDSPGGVLDAVNYTVDVGDAASIVELTTIAGDADKGAIRITVNDAEGNPRSTTLGEYIGKDLIPQVEERIAINTTNDAINEITKDLAAEDVAALEAIANNPEQADLPVTVYAKDENGERIPSAGADGQPATAPDGNPIYETKTITMAEHIRENILPGVEERVAINTVHRDIDDILRELDPGDVTALEAIANDPDRANLSVSIYATNEEGERKPVVGENGEPLTDADGNVIHETKTVTVAEYIRDTMMPYAAQRAEQQESQAQTEVALGEIQAIVQGGIESYEINRLKSIANDPETSGLKISTTDADGNVQETTIGEYLSRTVEAYDNRQIAPLERIRNNHAKARDDWNNEAVDGLTRHGQYGMAQGHVNDIKDLEMRRLAQEKLDAAREAGVETAAIATRIKNAEEALGSARHEWQRRRARKEIRNASGGYRDFMNIHGYNKRSFEIAYSNLIAKAQGYELNPTNQAMYKAQQRAWGSAQAYTLPSSQGFRDSKENFDLQTAGGDAALQAQGERIVSVQATTNKITPEIIVPTLQLPPPTGLEAEEIGDLGQAQAESRIITAYQAEQYGDPSLKGQMRVEGRASDGSVTQAVVGQEFVEQARSYGLTPDQLYQGYVDDEESALHGAEGAAQPLAARAETAEFNRFRNEVVAAYAAPDVVDDEGFATSVNAHQHTRGTLEQLKSQYGDDPAKTAFLDSAIKQLDIEYTLHSLGTDAHAGKAIAVLAEQERRLKAQAVELGKVGTLEDIAQESGLAGTTEYRVWLADEQKYATLTGQEMQEMGVSNVLHDPWSQEARDLAAQGQNVLVERTVKPAAGEVKDDPGKAAAMANFAHHMLQFAAADSGGASTVVAMQKSAEDLAKESPAFAALPEAEQRKLLDHYDNPVKNPYTRAAVLAAASGMAGSIASGTAFGSSLVGQAALGVPFAGADVAGAYVDTGKVTGKDVGRALLFESLPFIPDVGSAAFKGGRHGVRSFATGGDFTDWAFGNVDSTLRIDLKNLSKSIPEGFTPQGGSIADNAVFAYGSPEGLKPRTVTEIQQEFGQSVQAQLFDLAADNPGKTVSVRLPDGRFITYTPPRAGALQEPGNPLFFSSSPDVGFVKDGSYVTLPLPLEKIKKAPVETAQFSSPGVPLKRFRRSSAFNVAGDSSSRGPVARAVFGEPSNPGVTAISKIDEAGAPNVALSGKVYQPGHGSPVIEVEGVRDINLPTAVPHQYGIGMPQARPGGLVTGYDQPKLLSGVQFAAGDVRLANLGGLVDQYGRFLPSGLRDRIGVRDVGVKVTPDADTNALVRDWTPTQVSLLGDGQEYSNIAKLHLERRYLQEMGVPEGDLPSSPSPLFNPRTRKYDDPVNEGLSAPGRLHGRSDPAHPDGQRAGGSDGDDGSVGSQQDNGLNRADADVDGDGIPNRADADVDGDGIPNRADADVDGDGIPNRADADVDGDGIPNRADSDVDGDGIPNRADADVDGDGIPNRADADVDGDGIPNRADADVDGDGIPNRADSDVDGDGIPNRADADVDGDGIPNRADSDVDGDGIPNRADADVDGDGIPNRADADVDGDGIPNRADSDVDATLSGRDGDFDSTSRPLRSVIDAPPVSPVLRTPDDMMGGAMPRGSDAQSVSPVLRTPEPPPGDPPTRPPEPPPGDPPLRTPEPPPGNPPTRTPEPPPGNPPTRTPEPPPGDPPTRTPEPPPGDPPTRTPEPPPGDPPTRTPEPPPGDPPTRRRRGDDETPRRREIPNPVADDPNRHPREVQFVDRNLHTVDLVTGEHTIEPLNDEQLRTIHIRSFSPENPQGQVHLAGSVELEVERQRIVAESADRRKDAGAPIDYRDINFLPGQGPARPSAQDLSRIQLQQSPGQLDYRDINFVEGQGPSRPNAQDLSRIQLQDQRQRGEGQQLDYRDIDFVDRESGRSGSSRKSKSSGRGGKSNGGNSTGGNSGDGSNINYRPGQGPAPAANRRSANNLDTGLMNGGGAARRRGGGGRRRRDEDEDERGYRRPVIQVVLEG